MARLVALRACPFGREHLQLAEWASTGALKAVSLAATVNGRPMVNHAIPPRAWRAVLDRRLDARLDRASGQLVCTYVRPGGLGREKLSATLIEFVGDRVPLLLSAPQDAVPALDLPTPAITAPARPSLPTSDLRQWVVERVRSGCNMDDTDRYKAAFPNYTVKQGRERVRNMYRDECREIRGAAPKQGQRVGGKAAE